MKHIPPPPIHWRSPPAATTAQRASQPQAGVPIPPTRFGAIGAQRKIAVPERQVIQPSKICSCLSKIFSCGKYKRVDSDDDIELSDDRSVLPDWGTATFLGYHWTGAWGKIKTTGFRAGGGLLGAGVYLCISDHSWVPRVYTALNTLLEVGYVGDMSNWKWVTIKSPSGFMQRDDCNDYDVIKTEHDQGPLNQICYRTDGPNNINIANFRVRLARVV